ncbi:hypothetical protein P872_12050 [Rhodonellum psychrophilum GCM71 = DSM 17998]|uniref:Uncharacterized protein n=1 Tax=Rhodonellum psychrophilum GCM71 = DSM 17998 TaxID=1123057 RepID=U5BWE3_9BACT|nr:hypothetical protein P872_12050 [Rhodonellum psychrophilum GCM71 = DSM 17998]
MYKTGFNVQILHVHLKNMGNGFLDLRSVYHFGSVFTAPFHLLWF